MIKYLSKIKKERFAGTALLRLDFNTEDAWRMEASVSTIRFLLATSEKVVILSHRGRPAGFERALSLSKDALYLEKLLGERVQFIPHFRFSEIKKIISEAPRGSIFLLENLRFLKGEDENSSALAKQLATLSDFYVNDAFPVCHRKAASVVAVTKRLPSYAGLILEKEIAHLSQVLKNPKHPLVVILGGAKAHDKLGVIKSLKRKADVFLLGGAAANTLMSLRGIEVENSIMDKDLKDRKRLKELLKYKNVLVSPDYLMERGMILDIGPKTISKFSEKIKRARTILWTGAMGQFERHPFDKGTRGVAKAIASNRKAFSVAGGGETITFLKKHKLDNKFSFISTGGGAMMNFLAGEKLPGIEALK